MSGPLGRIIAQVVVMSFGVVSRAFVQAYQQAVHNAKTGNTAAMTAQATARRNNKTIMQRAQALEILNLSTTSTPTPEEIEKQFQRYFEANDPAKGGSFYLQSKIYRAKEALERKEDAPATEEAPKEDK
jgi:mitochondrial import inner membrane translocase subunit TIM16